ncbi:S-methyl-5-thioribose-1-phosphate isomerase [Candidatus Bathyarchaeota archaeon]|nr:S-methyl-5-thioribose-1-phosphate isomerase [Candidatus Bathyarchaeota archaeon]
MRTIEWKDGTVITVDQTKLPSETSFLKMKECRQVASAIKDMRIRGAPLIGVAAAYGLALTAHHSKAREKEKLIKEIDQSAEILRKTRPTAANLFWAVDRVVKRARETLGSTKAVAKAVVDEAQRMADEDAQANRKIGRHGAKLIDDGDTVLTHCNAGKLATVDYGTALGVIRAAWEKGKQIRVVATETRPKLQGARLTAYELKRDGIPVTLITDCMVGYVISKRLVNKVVVGADRIVQDVVVNKIGTYTIAVLAHEHEVPFYVAAPTSTFDLTHTSKEVIIEERSPEEVTHFCSQRIAPREVEALNPAFDVTPMKYVSAIICETGVLSPTELKGLATFRRV